jgi:hypothetical protein
MSAQEKSQDERSESASCLDHPQRRAEGNPGCFLL